MGHDDDGLIGAGHAGVPRGGMGRVGWGEGGVKLMVLGWVFSGAIREETIGRRLGGDGVGRAWKVCVDRASPSGSSTLVPEPIELPAGRGGCIGRLPSARK